MAKYRHRIFEMYEFRDEAICALTPKSAHPETDATAHESWALNRLAVSHSGIVTHVKFKSSPAFEDENVSDLSKDFTQIAKRLVRNSKVLLDFTGVASFHSASIDELALFNLKLQTKGSRIALCCLAPEVQHSFFVRSNGVRNDK